MAKAADGAGRTAAEDGGAGAGLVPDELANRPIKEISQAEAHYFAIVTLRLAK